MAAILDRTGRVVAGALNGNARAAFTSTATQQGHETFSA
jgi:hypothetical protein